MNKLEFNIGISKIDASSWILVVDMVCVVMDWKWRLRDLGSVSLQQGFLIQSKLIPCMLSLCPSTFSGRGRLTTAGLKMCITKALIFLPLQLQATNKLLLLFYSFSTIRAGLRCRASCWVENRFPVYNAWFFGDCCAMKPVHLQLFVHLTLLQ